ncbi:MAG: glycosyltransferase family 4 protein, partial [Chloroflexaceae bacterium]|nr:glycosyltransferase family 4 protein [Chloroflexaceae bacterium]
MRVGLDARLNAYRRGGIPHYTEQLLAALAPLAPDDTLIALQHVKQLQPLLRAPNVQRATLFTPPHHRLEAWALPVELVPQRLDVVHCPDFVAPRRRTCPAVVTIHDLAFLHFPEILDDNARRYYGQVRETVQHADAVIAVSENTRADIANLLDLPAERVDVVYEAAAPRFCPVALPAAAVRQINGRRVQAGRFALFVSTIEPRKNLPTLLHALRVCIDRHPQTPYHLVIAGLPGWRDEQIYATARDLRLDAALTWLGGVSQDDLHWLYNACVLYANPSLYEGFGLPVLEALASGAAVLASHTSSLPEVAGDAAVLLPPLDVAAWADALEQYWHDADQRAML